MRCKNCGAESRDGLKFCPQCGNPLVYDPKTVVQPKSENQSEEASVSIKIKPDTNSQDNAYIELATYKCRNCGANLSFSGNTLYTSCPYCKTEYVIKTETIQKEVRPEGILPFLVTQDQAIEQFNDWLARGFWAPRNMTKFTKLNDLVPIFVPVWVFSTHTKTSWSGRSGMNRSRQIAYKDSDGITQYKTEYYVDWFPVNGSLENYYQAIPVAGSKTLVEHVGKMRKYNGSVWTIVDGYDYMSPELYDSKYLANIRVDTNIITLEEAMPEFKKRVENFESTACESMISGDRKILEKYNIVLKDIEHKLIYIPLYLSSFYYKKRLFHFIVNGRTKAVASGRKPISVAKVFLVIAIFIAFIALVAYFA